MLLSRFYSICVIHTKHEFKIFLPCVRTLNGLVCLPKMLDKKLEVFKQKFNFTVLVKI